MCLMFAFCILNLFDLKILCLSCYFAKNKNELNRIAEKGSKFLMKIEFRPFLNV